jgi:hypothetical protein
MTKKNPFNKDQQARELKTAETKTIIDMIKFMETLVDFDEKNIKPELVDLEDKAVYDEDKEWLKITLDQYKNELRLRSN